MGNAISRLPQAWASCFHPVERRDVVKFDAVIIVVVFIAVVLVVGVLCIGAWV